jgi:hypothetical protein
MVCPLLQLDGRPLWLGGMPTHYCEQCRGGVLQAAASVTSSVTTASTTVHIQLVFRTKERLAPLGSNFAEKKTVEPAAANVPAAAVRLEDILKATILHHWKATSITGLKNGATVDNWPSERAISHANATTTSRGAQPADNSSLVFPCTLVGGGTLAGKSTAPTYVAATSAGQGPGVVFSQKGTTLCSGAYLPARKTMMAVVRPSHTPAAGHFGNVLGASFEGCPDCNGACCNGMGFSPIGACCGSQRPPHTQRHSCRVY